MSVDAQVRQLTKAGCKKVFREVASGAKTDRAQLRRLLDQLEAGDVLTVTRLDRLARCACSGGHRHHENKQGYLVVSESAGSDIAHVVLRLAGADDEPPVTLTPEEQAAIAVSKAAAARGEFATDEQVRLVWAKHGL